eukprot:432700-Amphidinium_carterae.1
MQKCLHARLGLENASILLYLCGACTSPGLATSNTQVRAFGTPPLTSLAGSHSSIPATLDGCSCNRLRG